MPVIGDLLFLSRRGFYFFLPLRYSQSGEQAHQTVFIPTILSAATEGSPAHKI